MNTLTTEQRTKEWFQARLGNITGSCLGKIMKTGRKETFSDTAKTYLYRLAAERSLDPRVTGDEGWWEEYMEYTSTETKAMRFGTLNESDARQAYERRTGHAVTETGLVAHPAIPHFASSPDGLVTEENGCIEIKCPNVETFMRYKSSVRTPEELKAVNPYYYYQCQAHMMCTGAEWCDFIVFCIWTKDKIHILRLTPDTQAESEIEQRIQAAEQFITQTIRQAGEEQTEGARRP